MTETFLFIVAITLTFTSIFVVYCFIHLRKEANEPYFRKRGVPLLYAYLIISGINQVIILPLNILIAISVKKIQGWYYINYLLAFYAANTRYIFALPFFFALNYHTVTKLNQLTLNLHIRPQQKTKCKQKYSIEIIILRIFLQFVNIRRSEESSEWKKQLNPNHNTWVLKYYHIVGNSKALLIFSIITTMIEIVISVFIVILYGFPVDEQHFNSVNQKVTNIAVAVWFARFVVVLICICKLGKFVDYWDIRKEFKYLSIVLLSCITVGMIALKLSHHNGFEASSVFPIITSSVWSVCSWYISTIWVTTRHKQKLNKNEYVQEQKPKLLDIIETNEGYQLFMNHLKSEFAMENLLFLTHMIQWYVTQVQSVYGIRYM